MADVLGAQSCTTKEGSIRRLPLLHPEDDPKGSCKLLRLHTLHSHGSPNQVLKIRNCLSEYAQWNIPAKLVGPQIKSYTLCINITMYLLFAFRLSSEANFFEAAKGLYDSPAERTGITTSSKNIKSPCCHPAQLCFSMCNFKDVTLKRPRY